MRAGGGQGWVRGAARAAAERAGRAHMQQGIAAQGLENSRQHVGNKLRCFTWLWLSRRSSAQCRLLYAINQEPLYSHHSLHSHPNHHSHHKHHCHRGRHTHDRGRRQGLFIISCSGFFIGMCARVIADWRAHASMLILCPSLLDATHKPSHQATHHTIVTMRPPSVCVPCYMRTCRSCNRGWRS